MHIQYHLLFFQSVFLYPIARGLISDPFDHNDLLLGNLFSPNAYEILSIHEDGDEDIVRLKKRASESDCGTDCLSYSGWEEDGVMNCDDEDADEDGLPEKRAMLLKRGRKEPML